MELGLVGKSLNHSFSKDYFAEKFQQEGLHNYSYHNFELERIEEFPRLLRNHPHLKGLNVTIPYKEAVIPFLDELSAEAKEVGAVNTIKFESGLTKGYNTDIYGFGESLKPLLRNRREKALILGTGGASKAVKYALRQQATPYLPVSRKPEADEISYEEASLLLGEYMIVINTTPVGTFPKTEEMPPLRLDNVSENHLFYDLIYNPPQTKLLREAKKRGGIIKNGYEMLVLQAERAWQVWHRGNQK